MQGRKLWASPAEWLLVRRPQMLPPSLLGVPAQLSIFPLTVLTFAVGVWELELDGKAWYEALASDPKRDAGSPSAASQNPVASLTSFPAGAPYKHR